MSSSTHSSTSLAYTKGGPPSNGQHHQIQNHPQMMPNPTSRSPSVLSSRSGSIQNLQNQNPQQYSNQQQFYHSDQPHSHPQRSNTAQQNPYPQNGYGYAGPGGQQQSSAGMGGMIQRGANSTGPVQTQGNQQQVRQPQRAATTGPGMFSQSNTSMPSLDAGGSSGPPLADDVGSMGFDSMHLGPGTPTFGAQRSKSPGPRPGGGGPGAVDRANAMYANQEIHQSASEVYPENSLAAIAAEVDQAATELKSDSGPHAPSGYEDGGNWGGMAGEDRRRQYSVPSGGYDPSYEGGGYEDPSTYGADSSYYGQQGAGSGYAPDDQSHMGQGGSFYPPEDGSAGGGFYGQAYPPGSFAQPGGYQPQASHQGNGAYLGGNGYMPQQQPMYDQNGNPYFATAQGFAGYPDGYSYGGEQPPRAPSAQGHHLGPPSLVRQGTQLSMASSANSLSTGRRKSKESAQPQQTLPFNKAFVEEYRNRMKGDPDPEAQFAFAKYLIEAAKKVQDTKDGPKQARKYRDTLLSDSLKLVKRLATTGTGLGKPPYSEAQFFLANCFGNGSLGLSVDHEKAYNLYVQASKQNHPAATYRTAVCNEVGAGTRRDHHRAVLFYRKASALGDTAGMYKLGMILLSGLLGQPRNTREAVVWLKRAAGQADDENPHALHELGLLHEKSTNSAIVIHDEAYARELFTQAAQLGYAPAQFKLGSAYEYGSLTCAVDPRRSIAWYTKAAGKGDGESELALSGWYLTGSEGVLKQSDSEAYLWARRAATKGIPKAEYAVGYYSEVGIGVKADLDEAKRWYMRAAAQGNKRAMQRLTELKKMGSKAGKKGARPTRKDAESECVIC